MADDKRYTTSQLVEMLQRCNIRPSVQRVAVLSYVANGSKHPAAEEIYASLSQTFYSLSRTTVYNSLHILAEKGLVRELEIESGCIRLSNSTTRLLGTSQEITISPKNSY